MPGRSGRQEDPAGGEGPRPHPRGKYSGSEVKVDEEEYLIMKEEDLLAIIE